MGRSGGEPHWHGRCSYAAGSDLTATALPTTREDPNEEAAARLHPDRADDRGRDHRHSGGGRATGLSGLHHSREDVGGDSRYERLPHLGHGGVPVRPGESSWPKRLGLRSPGIASHEVRAVNHYRRERRCDSHGDGHLSFGEWFGRYADPVFDFLGGGRDHHGQQRDAVGMEVREHGHQRPAQVPARFLPRLITKHSLDERYPSGYLFFWGALGAG